jgi:hypothetical protein
MRALLLLFIVVITFILSNFSFAEESLERELPSDSPWAWTKDRHKMLNCLSNSWFLNNRGLIVLDSYSQIGAQYFEIPDRVKGTFRMFLFEFVAAKQLNYGYVSGPMQLALFLIPLSNGNVISFYICHLVDEIHTFDAIIEECKNRR